MIKGVEMIFIGGGNYFGDVEYERSFGVVVMDINGNFIVYGIFVEGFSMVVLGGDGRRKVQNYYFKKRVSGGKESMYNSFEELFVFFLVVVSVEFELQFVEESGDFVFFEVYDGVEDFEDGVQDELVEGMFKLFVFVGVFGGLFFGVRVEEVVVLLIWLVNDFVGLRMYVWFI